MSNLLAQSRSLYLRKHADNPIDWHPWDDDALEAARAQDKPIFLSVGYSSCHWCTVMEGEAFSNPEIAAYMNDNFLPIKVDREERPDLDSIYMQALQMMTGQGGWPLNIFLTPQDRVPFYGGTYFPVDPRYGRPGFLDVLKAVRNFYDSEKAKLSEFKQEIVRLLQQSAQLAVPEEPLPEALLFKGCDTATGVTSARDRGPNFPMIPHAQLALQGTRFDYESLYDSMQVCAQRGIDLVLGGIYDHVGGGFHRYTVDGTWTVPHFEKMLYDNGQILEFLANLWSEGVREPAIARAVAGTVSWLRREMTAPAGYFYAAQDADSFAETSAGEPEEGVFYVWREAELRSLITAEELTAMQAHFCLPPGGNFEGKNVLQRQDSQELPSEVEAILAKLFGARYGESPEAIATFPPATSNQAAKTGNWPGRIPPVTDPKMIAAWNSMTISGLARSASVFGKPEYRQLAQQAAEFILQHQWVGDRFHRLNYDGEIAVAAQSEDYALFVKALLDLHASDPGTGRWLESARAVQAEFDARLWSQEGGYLNVASDIGREAIVAERSYADNATPAANGVAVVNLVRLHLLTENVEYLDAAEKTLIAFSQVMQTAPAACPGLFAGLDWYRNGTLVRSTPDILSELSAGFFPTTVCRVEADLPEDATALVCRGLACLPTARSREMLYEQIQKSQLRGH